MEITIGKPKPKAQDHPDPGDKKQSGGFFGSSKTAAPAISDEIKDEVNGIARRLKLLEEHFTILRRKADVNEHNLMSRTKNFSADIKTIHSEMSDLRQTLNKIEDKVLVMIKEFQLTAKKEDLDILKKYVDMWSPIRFVTREEVDKIVQEALDERGK